MRKANALAEKISQTIYVNRCNQCDVVVIYVSDPLVFEAVRVVKSVVKSDHLAVVAYSERGRTTPTNQTTRARYRPVTPGQHAAFLQYVKDVDFTAPPAETAQTAFDNFYNVALGLLG